MFLVDFIIHTHPIKPLPYIQVSYHQLRAPMIIQNLAFNFMAFGLDRVSSKFEDSGFLGI